MTKDEWVEWAEKQIQKADDPCTYGDGAFELYSLAEKLAEAESMLRRVRKYANNSRCDCIVRTIGLEVKEFLEKLLSASLPLWIDIAKPGDHKFLNVVIKDGIASIGLSKHCALSSSFDELDVEVKAVCPVGNTGYINVSVTPGNYAILDVSEDMRYGGWYNLAIAEAGTWDLPIVENIPDGK